MRVAKTIELDEQTERELRVLAKRRTVEARLQQRALVVLLAAEGLQNKDIAVEAGLDRRQVAMWRERFLAGGIDSLRKDAPRDSFTSVQELELAIDLYVAHHNIDPKPFIWTASAKDILAKVTRAKAAMATAAG